MKARKKPAVVGVTQWFKNGDHPCDDVTRCGMTPNGKEWEGRVVRYFNRPEVSGATKCQHCGLPMRKHGWIDTLEGGHIVCPGDWIITGLKGEHYPCKDSIFKKTYDLVEPERS